MRFDYTFDTAAPHTVNGSARLDARLSDGSGWHRTFQLGKAASFTGDSVLVGGPLRVDRLRRLVDRFESLTGVHNDSYHLTLIPRIRVAGIVAGVRIRDAFAPPLEFDLDPHRLALSRPGPGNGGCQHADAHQAGGRARSSGSRRLRTPSEHRNRATSCRDRPGRRAPRCCFPRPPPLAEGSPERAGADPGAVRLPAGPRDRRQPRPHDDRRDGRLGQDAGRPRQALRDGDPARTFETGHAYVVEAAGVLYRYTVGEIDFEGESQRLVPIRAAEDAGPGEEEERATG